MGRKILIFLADVTAAFHIAIFETAKLSLLTAVVIAILMLSTAIFGGSEFTPLLLWLLRMVVGLVAFPIALLLLTGLGQAIFQTDCPLRVFEYCLRGLAGQNFWPERFVTMVALLPKRQLASIYRVLLLESGAYLAAAALVVISATILIPLQI